MGLEVNIVCRNFSDDRVIPRFSRYLRDFLGYDLSSRPIPGADLYYLSGYFEIQMMRSVKGLKLAAYFTHREEYPPNNSKSRLFDSVGNRVDLRIATAAKYAQQLLQFGDTVQISAPVERSRFTIPKRAKNQKITAGFSGYIYPNKRKGENIARDLINSKIGRSISWVASGRGWPIKTVKYPWREMPDFYQSLDILIVSSTVEGVPMPPLEVLSCGGSVVIPRDVGLLDELPDLPGIYRYKKGSSQAALQALQAAIEGRSGVDRGALRDITAPFSILAWCEQHRAAFEEIFA